MSGTDRKVSGGFTLIEVMVAITILSIILAMIYASFSSVVLSVEDAREESEKLRTKQFLARSLTENLAQALEGWSPGAAYRTFDPNTAGGAQGGQIDRGVMRYQFIGSNESGPNGPQDTMSFASSAPMAGAEALPGQIKLVSLQLQEDTEAEDARWEDRDAPQSMALTVSETPLVTTGTGLGQGFTNASQQSQLMQDAAGDMEAASVSWSMPVYALDLAYYDGQQWRETWDSQQIGRLPWMVRARVKLTSPEDDEFASRMELDPEEDPNVIELLFTVPAGVGVYDEPPDYARPAQRGRERS